MPDIVEQLRRLNAAYGAAAMLIRATEAADEIERLRALLRDIYDWCGKDCPHWQRIEEAIGHA